jgi:spore maturation protein CgeB
LKGLKEFDVNFVFRQINVSEAILAGAANVRVLMPYFVRGLHRPKRLDAEDRERYECDAVFVGHYEPDGRERYLYALVDAGLHVRLFGGSYWGHILGKYEAYFGKVPAVSGEEYTKALCGAKMCLSFLSKLNRDTYTTRCFEIPACGQLLLCERTADLQRIFKEDKEAVFFSSPDELARKALWLKSRPAEAMAIAKAGMDRIIGDGHEVEDRVRQMLEDIEECTAGRWKSTADATQMSRAHADASR